MKIKNIFAVIAIVCGTVYSAFPQQELTHTTTPANTNSAMSSINLPGLTGNPLAIIVATPIGNTRLLNTHPLGAWYYSGKWYLFNSDQNVMPVGGKYQVQFFLEPGPNQFLHVFTKENIGAEGSYIDHPELNGKPGARFKILQNHAPEVRPNGLNRSEAQAAYSTAAGRWYIANINGEPIYPKTVYNIVIISGPVASNGSPTQSPAPPTGGVIVPVYPPPYNPTLTPAPTPVPTAVPGATPIRAATPVATATPRTGIPTVVPSPAPAPTPNPVPTPPLLQGFADMHTHPMSHLAFGKKLLHGAPDTGMIIPAGTRNCNPADFRASTINEALGSCSSTHGGWGISNPCGDHLRALIINRMFDKDFAGRLPGDLLNGGNLIGDHQHEGIDTHPFNFTHFPSQTSKVHQQMWWEWIKRAKELGNLRVMVALTVNSDLLANVLNGDSPKDDKASADLQLDELKLFISRHSQGPNAWMEIAYTPADLRRIVGQNKLAVILGMEVDNIRNFNKPGAVVNQATVKDEIQRLYNKGVRYVFPIHLVNNKFGGTAVYEDLFNFSNKYSTGSFFSVSQSSVVNFKLGDMSDVGVLLSTDKGLRPILEGLKLVPYPPAFNADPTSPDFCMNPLPFTGSLGCFRTFKILSGIINPPSEYQLYNTIPKGHVNDIGLTGIGKFAIAEMMKLGMIIDIDHMSDLAQADTLRIAEEFQYPVNIGHNGIQNFRSSERVASLGIVKRIAALGGVFGVGTADSEEHHYDVQNFMSSFSEVWTAMGGNTYGAVAIGTDANGMERLPRAPSGVSANFYNNEFPASKTGNRTWNYPTEGVAHYGLMADFLRDVKSKSPSVYENLMNSAEHFVRMWEKAHKQKSAVK